MPELISRLIKKDIVLIERPDIDRFWPFMSSREPEHRSLENRVCTRTTAARLTSTVYSLVLQHATKTLSCSWSAKYDDIQDQDSGEPQHDLPKQYREVFEICFGEATRAP